MQTQGFGIRFQEVKGLADRLERATRIFDEGRIERVEGRDAFIATNSEGKHYLILDGSCSCKDFKYGAPRSWCKHRLAAEMLKEATPEVEAEEVEKWITEVEEERSLEDKRSDLYH